MGGAIGTLPLQSRSDSFLCFNQATFISEKPQDVELWKRVKHSSGGGGGRRRSGGGGGGRRGGSIFEEEVQYFPSSPPPHLKFNFASILKIQIQLADHLVKSTNIRTDVQLSKEIRTAMKF